jgi:hypothetical protein
VTREELKADLDEALAYAKSLKARLASALAALEEARKALEPFAREAVTWSDALPDDNRMRMASGEEYPAYAAFTMGALRCARAALARIDAIREEPK